jgi:CRP-like cAMP-binding protein
MEISEKLREYILNELIPINQLSADTQGKVMQHADISNYHAGEYLFQRNDMDNFTYYLLAGKTEMQIQEGTNKVIDAVEDEAKYPLAQVKPRLYSARAITEIQVLKITDDLIHTLDSDTEMAESIIVHDESDASIDEENGWMSKLLQSHIFNNIPFEDIQKIFLLFEKISVKQNDIIIRQGDSGDYYYIIDEGHFQVTRKISNQDKEFTLAELHEGNGFGEEALIGNVERNATIKALSDGILTRIKKDDFVRLIKEKVLKSISYDETKKMVRQGALCLDARFKNEFDQAPLKLKGCLNFPLNTLRLDVDKLDKNFNYVVYCDNGARSAIEAFLLMERGFNVWHLEGGINPLLPADDKCNDPTKNNEQNKAINATHVKKSTSEILDSSPSINAKQIIDEQVKIISKLNLNQNGNMSELSNVLSVVFSNIYTQLEHALQEKTKAEKEKQIIEQKLQKMLQNNKSAY